MCLWACTRSNTIKPQSCSPEVADLPPHFLFCLSIFVGLAHGARLHWSDGQACLALPICTHCRHCSLTMFQYIEVSCPQISIRPCGEGVGLEGFLFRKVKALLHQITATTTGSTTAATTAATTATTTTTPPTTAILVVGTGDEVVEQLGCCLCSLVL